ncbi:MAG TPA: DnaJ domain-containing protein [Kofleriaceae bacterium]|jgi:curved DNA-binding protein CbpA|nr:DnaJ domain-containing protein [Kofleriaceae bacterium]
MFLKASTQPAIGTIVKIDLELPSATVIELTGTIVKHVTDPQRGTGVDLQLEPLPTKSVWMIENALAAETKVRAASQSESTQAAPPQAAHRAPTLSDGEDVSAAEVELIRALEAEAESLKKLNPFLILGVGYETTDVDVRHAFGELTKRYHPDRFARYQSGKLRQIAAEIFILIRDAYRRLADEKSRQQVVATLGRIPQRAQTQPRGSGPAQPPQPPRTGGIPKVSVPAIPPKPGVPPDRPDSPTKPAVNITQQQHDAPTNPSGKTAELAHTELARAEQNLAIPVEAPKQESGKLRKPQQTPPGGLAATDKLPAKRATSSPIAEPVDTTSVDDLIDEGKLDEALNGYRILAKKHPQDRACRAGIELVEGLKALVARDRLEAAQRFEAALELDPSNERAARELAEMRRQATNERKGLLSRLMGKKEPLP